MTALVGVPAPTVSPEDILSSCIEGRPKKGAGGADSQEQQNGAAGVTSRTDDASWDALPRTEYDPFAYLAKNSIGLQFTPEELFRNRWLNPVDIRIGKSARVAFQSWVSSACSALREVNRQVSAVKRTELLKASEGTPECLFEDLPAATQADIIARMDRHIRILNATYSTPERKVEFTVDDAKKRLAAEYYFEHPGDGFMIASILGRTKRIPVTALERSIAMRQRVGPMMKQLAYELVAWFSGNGCLDDKRIAELAAHIEQLAW